MGGRSYPCPRLRVVSLSRMCITSVILRWYRRGSVSNTSTVFQSYWVHSTCFRCWDSYSGSCGSLHFTPKNQTWWFTTFCVTTNVSLYLDTNKILCAITKCPSCYCNITSIWEQVWQIKFHLCILLLRLRIVAADYIWFLKFLLPFNFHCQDALLCLAFS